MKLLINGSPHECTADVNILELLVELDMHEKKVALEINKEIIPRGQYLVHTLNDGDKIEIIQAIGGG